MERHGAQGSVQGQSSWKYSFRMHHLHLKLTRDVFLKDDLTESSAKNKSVITYHEFFFHHGHKF